MINEVELERQYPSIERLKAHPEIARFVEWVKHKPDDVPRQTHWKGQFVWLPLPERFLVDELDKMLILPSIKPGGGDLTTGTDETSRAACNGTDLCCIGVHFCLSGSVHCLAC